MKNSLPKTISQATSSPNTTFQETVYYDRFPLQNIGGKRSEQDVLMLGGTPIIFMLVVLGFFVGARAVKFFMERNDIGVSMRMPGRL